MKDEDTLEQVRLIAGKTREIQGKLYCDEATDAHERIDALLLSLLEKKYPETVEYVQRLKFCYG
jgi:hypothetical protein